MIERPLKTVGDLIEFLQLHVPSSYELELRSYGCGQQHISPVHPTLFEVDRINKTVRIMADWN